MKVQLKNEATLLVSPLLFLCFPSLTLVAKRRNLLPTQTAPWSNDRKPNFQARALVWFKNTRPPSLKMTLNSAFGLCPRLYFLSSTNNRSLSLFFHLFFPSRMIKKQYPAYKRNLGRHPHSFAVKGK